MKDHPFSHDRGRIKEKILRDLINEYKDNIVIAVSPIFHAVYINSLIILEKVIAIELQDSKEHIFERMVFSDENDNIYKDDEYKEMHKDYYINDIHEDIVYIKKIYKNIKNKYFINNQSVEEVVDELYVMINNIVKMSLK